MDKLVFYVHSFIQNEVQKVIEIENIKDATVKNFTELPQDLIQSNSVMSCRYKDIIYATNENKVKDIPINCLSTIPLKEVHKIINDGLELILPVSLIKNYEKQDYYIISTGMLQEILHLYENKQIILDLIQTHSKTYKNVLILDTYTGLDDKSELNDIFSNWDAELEILPVSLDILQGIIRNMVIELSYADAKEKFTEELIEATKRGANYELVFELIQQISGLNLESEVIEKIFMIFNQLYSPQTIYYISMRDNKISEIISTTKEINTDENIIEKIDEIKEQYLWCEEYNGFGLKISYNQNILGYLLVCNILFPEYKERYINVGLIIAKVCGLALFNSRNYQQLQDTLAELKTSNEDLENFAHIISHDLKQPLTRVYSSADLLENIFLYGLDMEPIDLVNQIKNSTRYLSDMIDGVLSYSKIGSKNQKKEEIDLNAIIDNILVNLESIIEETNAKININRLPSILASRIEITQLFKNLIENAIKFRRKNQTPEINISVKENPDELLFIIKDNGIGINEEYKDIIFEMFHRGVSEKDYSGTGIGLSICKKIIESYNGEIWFSSAPEQGTTFYFTIPKNK